MSPTFPVSIGSYPDPARRDLEHERAPTHLIPERSASHANSRKVKKPPFRSRRDGVTAESAAERVHFRHTSRGHDISLYLQCEHDSPAAVRKPAMKAVELETWYARTDLRPDLELVHWSEKCVEQTN